MLHVYPGDKVQLEVYVKYTDPQADETQVAAFIAEMAMNAFNVTPPPGGQETLASSAFQSESLFANGPWLEGGTIDEDVPKGRLNFILFDRDYVPVDWGFKQVSEAAYEDGEDEALTGRPHERLAFEEINVPVAGYLFVYVSNEDEQVVDILSGRVGFDDLKVTHTHSPLQQVTAPLQAGPSLKPSTGGFLYARSSLWRCGQHQLDPGRCHAKSVSLQCRQRAE